MNKNISLRIAVLAVSIVVTFFAVITGNFFTKKLSLQVGQIAKETIYAPFQVENEMATNRKKELAEKSVLPTYKVDIKVQEKAIADIEMLFDQTLTIKTTDIAEKLSKSPLDVLRGRSLIGLYKDEYETLLGAAADELYVMKEECIRIAAELFENGIKAGELDKGIEVRAMLQETELNVTYQKVCEGIILGVMKPNVILDEAATSEAKELEREKVDAVYILQGEKIVEQGTRVTEEIYNVLNKVGYLETNKNTKYKHYLGISVLIILVLVFIFRYIRRGSSTRELLDKQMHLIMILYILSILTVRILLGKPFVYLPLAIAPMLIALLIDVDIALITNMIIVIFASIIVKGDIIFTFYFMITAIINILIVSNIQERKKTMSSALVVGVVQLIAYLALKLFTGAAINLTLMIESGVAFVIGMISVIVVVGTLPLLESAFDFVTPMQLLELTNPNQPILKRLLLEATGTYYHSLLVANLAETAADAIGANPLMARVGGYYHDIGKLTCSNYFKENQTTQNPHDTMDPIKSFQMVVSHVSCGVSLANEYHLPLYIKDIIMQHHGTSVMQYFYAKAKEQKGMIIKEDQFRYSGPKPKTKEAALVMLADVVEATVRSMQDKLGIDVTIEQIVRKMVKLKLEEGQLDDCELYISDIDKIIDSFNKMLKGMYHARIQYPERNEK
jgi:putative nucleotidyltransferase with HDIG domain